MPNKLADCFDGLEKAPDVDELIERVKAEPRKCYLICFTPRSGSSWVSDLLISTKVPGRPLEWVNPNFVRHNAEVFGANNIHDYLFMLMAKTSSPAGVFGMEASFFQLNLTQLLIDIFSVLGEDTQVFYLSRKEFVL